MTLKCGDRTWSLHKNILCSRSVWFEKALTGNFEEAKTGVIEIRTFDPEPVDWMVRYIYSGSKLAPSLRNSRHLANEKTTGTRTGKRPDKKIKKASGPDGENDGEKK